MPPEITIQIRPQHKEYLDWLSEQYEKNYAEIIDRMIIFIRNKKSRTEQFENMFLT